jgi:hypothetical protein
MPSQQAKAPTARKRPEERKKTGRPLKEGVDEAVTDAICKNLELCLPLDLAAEAEKVSRTTVHRWMREFPEFLARVTHARALGARNLVSLGLKGGKGSASANWHLERRFREYYGPVQKIDHTLITKDTSDADGPELARQIAAWKSAVLATDLPTGLDGLDDPSIGADEADAGAAPPSDAALPDSDSER